MRLLLVAFSSLILSSCAFHEEYHGRKWVTYTAPDKKFSVEIPEGYSAGNIEHDDDLIGEYQEPYIHWRFPSSWIPDFDIKMMQASYIEIPEKFSNKQQIFHYLANDASKGLDTHDKKTIKKDITVNGYQGKKYQFKYESSVYYLWAVLVDSRVYFFAASVYNNYQNTADIERIFTSFKPL